MPRRTVVLAVTSVCAVAGLLAWTWLDDQSGIQYRTTTVPRGDINVTVSATGNPNAAVLS
jgi:hypothetical protein